MANIRTVAVLSGLAAVLVLQGCNKTPPVEAPAASAPAVVAPAAPAAPSAGAGSAAAEASVTGKPTIELAVAKDQDTKPATSFAADTPKLYAFFRSKGTNPGDKLRGVWIAEDVGAAAPKETKIDEATITADAKDFFGAFSLSKPTAGWPVGKYRVESYVGDDLVGKTNFSIE